VKPVSQFKLKMHLTAAVHHANT